MTVMSVIHRSAVDRSTIPYCNSDVIINVGGRQVGSVKNYKTLTLSIYRSAVDRLAIPLLN